MARNTDLAGNTRCELCMTYVAPDTYRVIELPDVDDQGEDCLEPVAICEICARKVEDAR